MKGWLHVWRKEIREFTRDRRVVMSAVFGPLFMELMIMMLFGFIGSQVSGQKAQKILVENGVAAPEVMSALKSDPDQKFEFIDLPQGLSREDALGQKKGRAVLSFPDNFAGQVGTSKVPPEIKVFVDPHEATGDFAFAAISKVLQKQIATYTAKYLKARQIAMTELVPYTLKREEIKTSKPVGSDIFASFLPYLIILFAFYGGFSIVSDLVAGEKERGSLETLLVSPLSRTAIAVGKFAALATVSLTGCLSALLGVFLPGILHLKLTEKLFSGGIGIAPASLFALAIAVIPLVIFFAGILLAVSAYSRTQREVQSYLSLMSFVVLVPAVFSQVIGLTDLGASRWVSFVPILNTASVIREALLNKVDWTNLAITGTLGIALAVFALWLAVRMFLSEKVLLRV
ncbi:MAG: ABC transporter permease [Fimbriimonadales bacterium]